MSSSASDNLIDTARARYSLCDAVAIGSFWVVGESWFMLVGSSWVVFPRPTTTVDCILSWPQQEKKPEYVCEAYVKHKQTQADDQSSSICGSAETSDSRAHPSATRFVLHMEASAHTKAEQMCRNETDRRIDLTARLIESESPLQEAAAYRG